MQYIFAFVFTQIFVVPFAVASDCKTLTLGQVNFTDVHAKTAIAEAMLENLGYEVNIVDLNISNVYDNLAAQSIDAFLSTWLPRDDELVMPYLQNNEIQLASINLTGAKHTLAVPKYVYDSGVTSFYDLAKYKDKFGGYVYGLEPNATSNTLIKKMISNNDFNLGNYRIVPTTEQILRLQLKKKINNNQWILFLGWEPHPMNTEFDIAYLEGADNYFGQSTVHTSFRSGFRDNCPNPARLLSNLKFTVDMESEWMKKIDQDKQPIKEVVSHWLNNNQGQVNVWLSNVQPRFNAIAQEQ